MDFERSKVSVKDLDRLLDLALTNPTDKLSQIISGVKLGLVCVFRVARARLIEEERLVAGHHYHRNRSKKNQEDIDSWDDL